MGPERFSFQTAGEIRFGRREAAGAVEYLAGRAKRVMLVHGSRKQASDWLASDLADRKIAISRFVCHREPDIAMVEEGLAEAKSARISAVVSLGGGSVIDLGKAIAALVPARRPMLDHLEVVGKGLPLDHAPLPFVAIPTTAGTGAEVTKNAVIGVPESRRKVSLRDNRMFPSLAIVDPALTDHCPASVTLASGLDAVTQVIEPYLSTKANCMTDALCAPAIPAGIAALIRLMQGEDRQARDNLAWVSLCGGMALANGGLGAVHGLAGPIGGFAPAPHGAVCGALLPHVLSANMKRADAGTAARIEEVAGWIGTALGVEAGQAFSALHDWSRKHGLPGLGATQVEAKDFPEIAAASLSSSSMKGNPVELSKQELIGILQSAA